MKITIDLDEARYPTEWNGDPDTEPRFVGSIQEAIVSHAAYQVRRDLFTERDKEATKREIAAARQEAINAQVAPIVADAIAEPLRKTNTYGEATGPEVTLRDLIIDGCGVRGGRREDACATGAAMTAVTRGEPMTTMTPEQLTQRLTALAAANVVRSERAVLKRQVKAGTLSVETLIRDPPSCMESARVVEVLLCVPTVGLSRVSAIVRESRVPSTVTLGTLMERERMDLLDALAARR